MVHSYSAFEQVLLDSEYERALTNFDAKGDDIYIGDSGASSHLTNQGGCMTSNQFKDLSLWQMATR